MNTPSSTKLAGRPVFVVRLWWEPGDPQSGSAGEWRGSVELSASGAKHYFHGIDEISPIIARLLNELSLPSPSPEKQA